MALTRFHHLGMISVGLGVLVGTWVGFKGGHETVVWAAIEAPVPVATDPRHPIDTYLVPPFLTEAEVVLQSLRIETDREDRLTFRPGIEFGLGGQLVIERALAVEVKDGNETASYRTWKETVGGLLGERQIELGDKDRVDPPLIQPLGLNQEIRITRVSVTEVTKAEPIGFKTKTEDDPNRPRGERVVRQKGVKGAKTLTYKVTRENNKEVERELIKTEVTKEPTEEVVAVGTRVVSLGQGRATWYDPPWSGLTAAHNTLPKGAMVDVVNVTNGKRVTVKVNDRGIQSDAVVDLSPEAFRELAPLGVGVIQVKLEVPG